MLRDQLPSNKNASGTSTQERSTSNAPTDARRVTRKASLGDMLCGLTGKDDNAKEEIQARHIDAAQASAAELATARHVFENAAVHNFTNVQYQFFSKIETDLLSGKIERVERRPRYGLDHVVNKWERAENGEYLDGYERNGWTAVMEASQLGVDPVEYRNLPARQKMQFAILNYRNDTNAPSMRSWGQSHFIISKEKCRNDGAIHFGDSHINDFVRKQGDYRTFPDRLGEDPYSVRVLNQNLQKGEMAPEWIEVNLKGGINLPGDIDKFVVSEQELDAMKDYIPVDEAKQHLNRIFGDKVEYRP